MRNAFKQFLQDNKGNYSHARLIALFVGFSATVFMWKLVITGNLSETYFFYFLAYGVAHQSINKFLDVAGAYFGINSRRNNESTQSNYTEDVDNSYRNYRSPRRRNVYQSPSEYDSEYEDRGSAKTGTD